MWCKDDNCGHYDREKDQCKRVGEDENNKGKVGVCWMNESEYNHGLPR